MRIVIDTNVLYSALRSNRGASYKLISKLPSNKFQVMLSVPLYTEYQGVLLKGDFLKRYSRQELLGFLRYICKICVHQDIFYLWRPILKDAKDDMVLELGVAGDCEYIVTHNIKDFADLE
jgi:putative PIN family toxin of toxin-antitoxin system